MTIKRDFRTLAPATQAELRRVAVAMVRAGKTRIEAAQTVGVNRRFVGQWVKVAAQDGEAVLAGRRRGRRPGEQKALSAAQEDRLRVLVARGCPDQFGLSFALWTRQAVRALIARETGVWLTLSVVGRYLRAWGFTAQRPARRATERRDEVVRAWLERTYPAIARKAKAQGCEIQWADETGLSSRANYGRSFAPRGHTPVIRRPGKRFSQSMISSLTNQGKLQYCSLCLDWIVGCRSGDAGLAAMAGVAAGLPAGVRLSDHISLGVIARAVPPERVRQVLAETGKASERERDLPAQVMVYYAIALALYMGSSTREVLRCLLEGLRWLWGAAAVKVAGKSGISQARRRLGAAPLRRLYEGLVQPIATPASKGAWYRDWRLVSLDGSCLEVADTAANRSEFGVPGASRGASAFPQLRFAALVENGTHVLFGARLGPYAQGEITLAREVLAALRPGMLCLADRQFFGHALWRLALDTGADLLWRVKHNLRLPREAVLADGSYLTTVYPSDKDRRHRTGGVRVRVVEYRLEGVAEAEPLYRLVTTILDPAKAPAAELAALYHERWEIEGALAELKTHLRGAQVVLRSKSPELVRQEFWGLLLAHFAVRGLMHEAALRADEDPDRLSFLHAVRVVRRKLPLFAALSPSGQARPA